AHGRAGRAELFDQVRRHGGPDDVVLRTLGDVDRRRDRRAPRAVLLDQTLPRLDGEGAVNQHVLRKVERVEKDVESLDFRLDAVASGLLDRGYVGGVPAEVEGPLVPRR